MRSDTVLPSVIDVIGDTPLVDLRQLAIGSGGRILVKLDYLNPGFSNMCLHYPRSAEDGDDADADAPDAKAYGQHGDQPETGARG